jgi:hypothetical protein
MSDRPGCFPVFQAELKLITCGEGPAIRARVLQIPAPPHPPTYQGTRQRIVAVIKGVQTVLSVSVSQEESLQYV